MNRQMQEVAVTPSPAAEEPAAAHYKEPDWFTRNVLNRLLSGLTRLGVSVMGSRVLEHRGRSTGKVFHTPVNLLTIDGTEYLVSPRGETQWVRNVRHAGGHLVLILGRRHRPYTATEVPVADSVPILRAYLLAEHTGCTLDRNGLTNTRTTLTTAPVRLLMWNMPYHAEHHLFPSIPFHRLAEAHAAIRDRLGFVQPGYLRWNIALVKNLSRFAGESLPPGA